MMLAEVDGDDVGRLVAVDEPVRALAHECPRVHRLRQREARDAQRIAVISVMLAVQLPRAYR